MQTTPGCREMPSPHCRCAARWATWESVRNADMAEEASHFPKFSGQETFHSASTYQPDFLNGRLFKSSLNVDPKCSAILMSPAKNICTWRTDTQPRKPTRTVYTAGYVRPGIGSLFHWGKHSFHHRNGSAMGSRPTYFWDTPLITFPGT